MSSSTLDRIEKWRAKRRGLSVSESDGGCGNGDSSGGSDVVSPLANHEPHVCHSGVVDLVPDDPAELEEHLSPASINIEKKCPVCQKVLWSTSWTTRLSAVTREAVEHGGGHGRSSFVVDSAVRVEEAEKQTGSRTQETEKYKEKDSATDAERDLNESHEHQEPVRCVPVYNCVNVKVQSKSGVEEVMNHKPHHHQPQQLRFGQQHSPDREVLSSQCRPEEQYTREVPPHSRPEEQYTRAPSKEVMSPLPLKDMRPRNSTPSPTPLDKNYDLYKQKPLFASKGQTMPPAVGRYNKKGKRLVASSSLSSLTLPAPVKSALRQSSVEAFRANVCECVVCTNCQLTRVTFHLFPISLIDLFNCWFRLFISSF